MRDPVILEWATWAALDHYKNKELILLKGHLLLEVALTHALVGTGTSSPKEAKAMSFRQKLEELRGCTKAGPAQHEQRLALQYAQALNTMRNRLAHEPLHDADGEELSVWAKQVLGNR